MENAHAQTMIKKAALVVLIKLANEAEKKTSEELETEIRKVLEEGFTRIPWVALDEVIIVKE